MIRLATPADIPLLLPLIESYWRFEGLPGFDVTRVARVLDQLLATDRLGAAWIAVDERMGEPHSAAAGYLLMVRGFSLEYGGLTCEIDELFVHPLHRGKGVARALLAAAENHCRACGCVRIELQVSRHNDTARRFYGRSGYTERPNYLLLEKTADAENSGEQSEISSSGVPNRVGTDLG